MANNKSWFDYMSSPEGRSEGPDLHNILDF
jgi:hypothetical protein